MPELKNFLCKFVVSAELGIELGMPELKNMYIIKKNNVDEGKVYILTNSSHKLILKFRWAGKIDSSTSQETCATRKVWVFYPCSGS